MPNLYDTYCIGLISSNIGPILTILDQYWQYWINIIQYWTNIGNIGVISSNIGPILAILVNLKFPVAGPTNKNFKNIHLAKLLEIKFSTILFFGQQHRKNILWSNIIQYWTNIGNIGLISSNIGPILAILVNLKYCFPVAGSTKENFKNIHLAKLLEIIFSTIFFLANNIEKIFCGEVGKFAGILYQWRVQHSVRLYHAISIGQVKKLVLSLSGCW